MRIVLTHGHDLLREVRIDKPLVVVGRDPACDIAIDDISVSKRHMKLEHDGSGWFAEDTGSTNGVKINGHPVKRQAVQHLDVIQVGSHRMYVFDEAMLPAVPVNPEVTFQSTGAPAPGKGAQAAKAAPADSAPPRAAALPLVDTQPTPEARAVAPPLGLQRLDRDSPPLRLDQPNTMIGESGQSAVLAWRRDSLYVSRLSRETVRVNGREVGAGSAPIRQGDLIEVGPARYLVVAMER
ncbi:MAG TPA: FHA domain-containing protein [Usitatibacter sp.]|nr:FHA domain-containing protein [Usitatibacter sp.]